MSTLREGWLLASGTLTVVRVPSPDRVDSRVAGVAMAIAPIAVLPLGAAAAVVALAGGLLGAPTLATAYAVIGILALGTRALHWDGLADTVDGLTASHCAERSLAVMRTGTSGPAGVLAIVLVAGVQAGSIAAVVRVDNGWLAVGLVVCASRGVLALACLRGVPPARRDGLGAAHVGSVPPLLAAATLLATGMLCVGATLLIGGPGWVGMVGPTAMVAVTLGLVTRCVRRLGGITGDVLGAAVEVSCAVLLVCLAAAI